MRILVPVLMILGVATAVYFGTAGVFIRFESRGPGDLNASQVGAIGATAGTAMHARAATGVASNLAVESQSADHSAFQTGDMVIRACRQQESEVLAAQVAPAAEFIDEKGNVFRGRDAVVQAMTGAFSHDPDARLETQIDSIRFVSPSVAIEDGTAAFQNTSAEPVRSHYTVVHVRTNGKWAVASLRESAVTAGK